MNVIPVQLGGLVEIVMGQAPPGATCNKDGVGTVFVKAGEFQERNPEIVEWTTKPLKMSRPHDTLICVVGATAGKVNYSSFDCAIGRSVAAVRPNIEKITPDFLFQYLKTKVEQLRNRSQGAAQGVITREMLQELRIYLPSLTEQRRIATILDKADALRAKRLESMEQLDKLAQSIFAETFGDVLSTAERTSLGTLVNEFRYGTSNKSGATGYPALRIPNVVGGSLDLANLKTVDVDAAELARLKLIDGDLLFVRTNGNPDYVGRCSVFNQTLVAGTEHDAGVFIYASYLIRARLKNERLLPTVLQFYLSTAEGRRELRSYSKTSAGQFNINTEGLGALRIPNFPMTLQKAFVARLASIEKQKEALRASARELDALFSSLQYRAFCGEL